jgi:hypothetical protein
VTAEHTNRLHAEDAAVEPEFLCSATMSLMVESVPFFPARRSSVETCTRPVTNFGNTPDLLGKPEVFRMVFHFLFHGDY